MRKKGSRQRQLSGVPSDAIYVYLSGSQEEGAGTNKLEKERTGKIICHSENPEKKTCHATYRANPGGREKRKLLKLVPAAKKESFILGIAP